MRSVLAGRFLGRQVVAAAVVVAAVVVLATAGGAATGATAPTNNALPSISGAPIEGQTVAANSGSWSGSTPMTFAYQWRRCDGSGGACADISGATSQTYAIQSSELSRTLRVQVTTTNSAGSGRAVSNATAPVTGNPATPPHNTAAPSVNGTATAGHTLTVSPGTWTGTAPITFSYLWLRCDTQGHGCASISGATAASWMLVPADVGHTLRAQVTGTNVAGSSQAISDHTGTVSPAAVAPQNTAAPVVAGTLQQGNTLSVSTGSWGGTQPISFAYQWQRCNAGGVGCAPISGATSNHYTLTSADNGNRVQVVVTAANSAGSSRKYSNQTGAIGATSPASISAPQIVGTTTDGQTLTVTTGSWSGTQPISFGYQWQRCNSRGANCTPIAGATSSRYTLTSGDVGARLQVRVTAGNSRGSGSRYSNQTGSIAAAGPRLPPGAIRLPDGKYSIPAQDVFLPDLLIIDAIQYPTGGHSHSAFMARYHVSDTAGYVIRDALVYTIGLPYGWILNVPEQPTGLDGWVTFILTPTAHMPRATDLVQFVRARTPQGNLLAGSSTRRLVQVRVRP